MTQLTKDFVPANEKDKPEEEQTRYHLRQLTKREKLEYTTIAARHKFVTTVEVIEYLIKKGLVGWTNHRNDQGEVVEFKPDIDYIIENVDPMALLILSNEISTLCYFKEEDAKN